MHYADINTSYIQNNEKTGKSRIFTNFKSLFLKFVKIRYSQSMPCLSGPNAVATLSTYHSVSSVLGAAVYKLYHTYLLTYLLTYCLGSEAAKSSHS